MSTCTCTCMFSPHVCTCTCTYMCVCSLKMSISITFFSLLLINFKLLLSTCHLSANSLLFLNLVHVQLPHLSNFRQEHKIWAQDLYHSTALVVEVVKSLASWNVKGHGEVSYQNLAKVYGTWRIPEYI